MRDRPYVERHLLGRARSLRTDSTDAEQKLWYRIRSRQLNGLKFRRQHVIGSFIADFYCHNLGLVIELDGGQHQEPGHERYDSERTRHFEACGLRVIRIWNSDVFKNLDGVLEHILSEAKPSP